MRNRRVAVLIESSRAFGRALLEGVARYSREHGTWSMYFEPRGLDAELPAWLHNWRGDGLLVRTSRPDVLDQLRASGRPVLDLYQGSTSAEGAPRINADNEAIARLAFDHFRGRGLTYFAFCGRPRGQNRFLDERGDAFQGLAAQAGFSCDVYPAEAAPEWDAEQARIVAWLRRLRKPIGVLGCHDDRGYQVLDACRQAGLAVPDEVAVVGVDDDPILCQMADPPMSSINPDGASMGYAAAAWLDRLMAGRPPPREGVCIAPQGLVARRSSDVLAVEDAEVAAALRRIRAQACAGLRVGDLAHEAAVSRSVLERKFRRWLGRTPKEEILRVQMDSARELLLTTEAPLREVARRAGFSSEKYFSDAFHRHTGVRPGAFRRRHRRPDL